MKITAPARIRLFWHRRYLWLTGHKNRLRRWSHSHFPLVLKRDYYKLEMSLRASKYSEQSARRDLVTANKVIEDVLPRLIRVDAYRPGRDAQRFRLQVDFSDDLVYYGFVHGNSREQIGYLAQRLSAELERELLTINFARFRDTEHDPYRIRPEQFRAMGMQNDS